LAIPNELFLPTSCSVWDAGAFLSREAKQHSLGFGSSGHKESNQATASRQVYHLVNNKNPLISFVQVRYDYSERMEVCDPPPPISAPKDNLHDPHAF
jgi:hypothetical protein